MPKVNYKEKIDKIREAAENDLFAFAKLITPRRVYGQIHQELFNWWTRVDAKDNTLVLLPRDHQKSHCAAIYVAWMLTKDPSNTVLYVSATSALAEKQLYVIKNIITSEVYKRYWPDMVNEDKGQRERWTTEEIYLDHPIRRLEGVRDPSVKAVGLTTNVAGFHATIVILDDIVVPKNAYTAEGRNQVEAFYSQLASVETNGAKTVVVGTRYHPRDIYNTMKEMAEDLFDDDGELEGKEFVYDIFERVVEEQGVFLWPRERRTDGKEFGFNQKILARKKAKYLDRTQFYAQYYNDPNDIESQRLKRENFNYYEPNLLSNRGGCWTYADKRLNVYAAIDFAFSLKKRADFSSIVVIGVDRDNTIYVLDIERFKTESISEYFRKIVTLHSKWEFRKMRAEVTVAQKAIVRELKDSYIKPNGLALVIDEFFPTKHLGTKEERIRATLEPRYENQQVLHYKGGYCTLLEDELVMNNPPHDDIKDALSAAVDICVRPTMGNIRKNRDNIIYHSKFGGIL